MRIKNCDNVKCIFNILDYFFYKLRRNLAFNFQSYLLSEKVFIENDFILFLKYIKNVIIHGKLISIILQCFVILTNSTHVN